jgi:hypothetical protein
MARRTNHCGGSFRRKAGSRGDVQGAMTRRKVHCFKKRRDKLPRHGADDLVVACCSTTFELKFGHSEYSFRARRVFASYTGITLVTVLPGPSAPYRNQHPGLTDRIL